MTDPVHGREIGAGAAIMQQAGGWSWREPSRGEHFRRCDYCGCIHPEDLVAEQGFWRAEWADRKYGWPHKFYVDVPNRQPEALYVLSASTSEKPPAAGSDRPLTPAGELTAEQRAAVDRDGWGRPIYGLYGDQQPSPYRWYEFGTRAVHNAKFYTVHLADPAIGEDVREAIFRRCGLRFSFTEGRVSWQPMPA